MKKLRLIIFSTVLILSFSGCEDFLEEKTRGVLAPATFFSNDEEANIAINGAYRFLAQVSVAQWSCGLRAFNLYGTDIVGSTTSNSGSYMEDYTVSETNYGIGDNCNLIATWRTLYAAINEANLVQESVRDNGALSPAVRERVEGEAIFIRAYAYYHLTNMWGDVPFYLESLDLTVASNLGRTNVSEVRQRLVDELTDIEDRNLLPESYSGSDVGRINKWAAMTLKAKIQLWQEDWPGALATCENIINNSDLRILENYEDFYDLGDNSANPYSGELIWGLDFSRAFANAWWVNPLVPRPSTVLNNNDLDRLKAAIAANGEKWLLDGRPQNVGLPDFVEQHPDDNRKPWNAMTEYEGIPLQFSYFWKLVYSAAVFEDLNSWGQIQIVFRYADVVLMAAEAAIESGVELSVPAKNALEDILVRAYDGTSVQYNLSDYTTSTNAIDNIRDERKWELAGEGQRKYDLIRWGILIETVRGIQNYANPIANGRDNIQDYHVKLPIPDVEILLNPKLLEADSQGLVNNGYR